MISIERPSDHLALLIDNAIINPVRIGLTIEQYSSAYLNCEVLSKILFGKQVVQ